MISTLATVDPVDELLRAVLRGDRGALDGRDDEALVALVERATAHRVIGPTVWALHDAEIELSDRVAMLAKERFQGAMAWCLELELRLLEIQQWFADAGGVEFIVLKGAAVAHLDEVDPSQRSFADLDLLVAAPDMDRALDALQAHGAERRIPQHHRGFDRRFVKGVGLTCPDGIEIDVHRTLCVGALGFRIPLGELFARPDHFTVGGERFAALRLEHRALHAAYHAVVGSTEPALHTLRDLSRYLARPELPPEVLVAEADRWGGSTVLWSAVRAIADAFGAAPAAWQEWADAFQPDEGDLGLIADSKRASPWPLDRGVWAELGWRDRLTYSWGVAWPTGEVLRQRGQTRWGRLRDGLTALVRRR